MLQVDDLTVEFAGRRAGFFRAPERVKAVADVSLAVPRARTLGLVGESGCGKTTLIRAVLGLQRATSGRVLLDGEDLAAMSAAACAATATACVPGSDQLPEPSNND